MLIRLPNGTWVNPSYILMVRPVIKEGNMVSPPCVLVHLVSEEVTTITCESNEEALTLASAVAEMVNQYFAEL